MTTFKHTKGNLYLLVFDTRNEDGKVTRLYRGSRNGWYSDDIFSAKVYRTIGHVKSALRWRKNHSLERKDQNSVSYVNGSWYPIEHFKALKVAQIIEDCGELIDL